MAKVDLHVHSEFSDGSDTLETLIKQVLANEIAIFALTDHDTVEGAKQIKTLIPEGIGFIQGVELTSKIDKVRCHILGYGCDCENEKLVNLIQKGIVLRRNKLETRIEFLKDKWGIDLTKEERNWLYSRNSVVKIHVANIIVNRGLAENNLVAMDKYLAGCQTPNSRFDGYEAIDTIKSAGAIPVWAHPLGGEGEAHIDRYEFYKRLDVMKYAGIMGLECYYSRYSLDEIEFLVDVAKTHHLLIAGGSDYHGKNKDVPIGRLNTSDKFVESSKLTILEELKY